ncbi:MAG: tetratricopeptide repeat protein, partial [Pedobacter sp.]
MNLRTLYLTVIIVLCALGKPNAQTPNDIQEISDRMVHTSAQQSNVLFLKQNKVYKQAKEIGDRKAEALALKEMGKICYQMGLFTQSLNFHIKAGEIFRSGTDERKTAENLNDLGLIFLITKQEKNAKQAHFKALSTYQKFDDKRGLAKTYADLGHYYEKTLNYDSAFYYQHKAMEFFESAGDAEGVALVHENLGSIYEDNEQFDKALIHFSKALSIFKNGNNLDMLIDAYNNVGDVHRKEGRYTQALANTRRAEQLAKQTKSYSRLSSAYRDLGKTYNFLNRTDSTFYYLELARTYFLRSYSEESQNQEALLKVIYGMDKKDMQIAEMGRQKKSATILYTASVIVTVLLIIIAFVIIRNQRHRILSEREIRAQEKRLLEAEQQLMEVELKNKQLQEVLLQENLQ